MIEQEGILVLLYINMLIFKNGGSYMIDNCCVMDEKDIKELIRSAVRVRNMAYARYSGFKVGAALLAYPGKPMTDEEKCAGKAGYDGAVLENIDMDLAEYRIFTGCNIENSSYGATICAERSAVCNAVSSGYGDFRAIAIVGGLCSTGISGITYPCGICRQVLSEFSTDMYVIAARSEDDYDMRKLSDFLPASFGAGQMI